MTSKKPKLTPRQMAVLTMTADGLTRKEISILTRMGTPNVESALREIRRNLGGALNAPHMISRAYQLGVLP